MKNVMRFVSGAVMLVLFASASIAQTLQPRQLQFFRTQDLSGLNMFETVKDNTVPFEGIKFVLGGASTLQYQALDHANNALIVDNGAGQNINQLIELGNNFNLATANMDIDVQLEDGLRMHLRTYLSSRHHHEPYVKGGYFQIDKLNFIKQGFLEDVMNVVTVKVGHMENNYGDAHFRRSDNALTFYNPFVENLLMDSFTTEVGGELYVKSNGWLAMAGFTNGKLNQDVTSPGKTGVAFVGKLGFDKQVNPELRLRLTGSMYSIGKANRIYMYSGDRTGSRYYSVMEGITATRDDFRSGRWNPNFADELTTFMVNPFMKWRGLEFFGTWENATGGDFRGSDDTRTWNQFAGELLYRFGPSERIYTGVRYNDVSGKLANADAVEVNVNRFQAAFGYFLTKNVGMKIEYMRQNYNDFPKDNILCEGQFDGVVAEAMIAF